MMAETSSNGGTKPRRDAYGFALRPQHVQRYREYSGIYKEEEDERSDKWKDFLENIEKSSGPCSLEKASKEDLQVEATEQKAETVPENAAVKGNDTSSTKSASDLPPERDPEKALQVSKETEKCKVQKWTLIRSSLSPIENMMSFRVKKGKRMKDEEIIVDKDHLPSIEEASSSEEAAASLGGASLDDVDEDICFSDALGDSKNASSPENSVSDGLSDSGKVDGEVEVVGDGVSTSVAAEAVGKEEAVGTQEAVGAEGAVGAQEPVANEVPPEPFFPWKLELESLVHGGLPKDLRGEVWQAFVGVKARRVERYYYDLLAQETNTTESTDKDNSSDIPRKWRRQIEKDIPRTFPGHPALNENGRNSLRRLLLAYARHNPSVGYCQAMNFFAGLLLLLMPEENAFWWTNLYLRIWCEKNFQNWVCLLLINNHTTFGSLHSISLCGT